MLHTSIFSTKDLFSWLQQNAERDCIQVDPGVHIHQHKPSLRSPLSPMHCIYTPGSFPCISHIVSILYLHMQSPVASCYANEYLYIQQACTHLLGSAGVLDAPMHFVKKPCEGSNFNLFKVEYHSYQRQT